MENLLDDATEVWLKLELFRKTDTFKVSGALSSIAVLTRMLSGAVQRGSDHCRKLRG
jgi:threonine dehydratase